MTSGKKDSNPSRDFICEGCGNPFTKVVYPSQGEPRFCDTVCRNRYVATLQVAMPPEERKGFNKCVVCDNVGFRDGPYCIKHVQPPIWTKEWDEILHTHYPAKGAAEVAKMLDIPHKSVLNRVAILRIKLTKNARERIVYSKAREHMRKNNPMYRPEVRAKVARYWKEHPEQFNEILSKLMEGHNRIAKDKPTNLERALFGYLDYLGVSYEPHFLIKPKFFIDAKIGDIIIQADGDYWHGHPRFEPLTERQEAQQRRDAAQDAYLTACGFRVARIWESDMSLEAVAQVLGLDPSI